MKLNSGKCQLSGGLAALLLVSFVTAQAQTSAPAGKPVAQPVPQSQIFEPPPVPQFMLRPPERPLTQEEMARQAEEAAARARRASTPQAPLEFPPSPGNVK